MSIKGKAYIAGIYEHPTRKATDKSVAQLHGEVAAGALADAGDERADGGERAHELALVVGEAGLDEDHVHDGALACRGERCDARQAGAPTSSRWYSAS